MLRLAGAGHAQRVAGIGADVLQGRALLPVDEINRGSHVQLLDADPRRGMPHPNELVGVGVGQRLQQHPLDDAENHRVRTDPDRQRQQNDCGEQRSPPKSAGRLHKLISEHCHSPGLRVRGIPIVIGVAGVLPTRETPIAVCTPSRDEWFQERGRFLAGRVTRT